MRRQRTGSSYLAHEAVAEDVRHGGVEVPLVAHQAEREASVLADQLVGGVQLLLAGAAAVDAVQRDDGHALVQLALVQQRLGGGVRVHHHLVGVVGGGVHTHVTKPSTILSTTPESNSIARDSPPHRRVTQ
eukprot:225486-Pyramimonas_sp.AAC.1